MVDFISVKDPKIIINNKKYIGSGSTCKCYTDGQLVYKIYTDSNRRRVLFESHEMEKHLRLLSEVSNERFIGPKQIIIDKDGKIIGYTMDYIPGKTIDCLQYKTRVSDIEKALDNLDSFVSLVSEMKYRLNDMHPKNALFYSDAIYIIDLDHGCFNNTIPYSEVKRYNYQDIFRTMVKGLFKMPQYKTPFFKDSKLDELYEIVGYKEPYRYKDFFRKLNEVANATDITVSGLYIKKRKLIDVKTTTSL